MYGLVHLCHILSNHGCLQIVSKEGEQVGPSIETTSDHDHRHNIANCLAHRNMLVVESHLESLLDVVDRLHWRSGKVGFQVAF